MNIMISINPPYTDMIFKGYKFYELRNKILNSLKSDLPEEGITAYIYETKNKGGAGAVIGTVQICDVYNVHYADNSIATEGLAAERIDSIKHLYMLWCDYKKIKPDFKKGWLRDKDFRSYQEKIRYYPYAFNHALVLWDCKRYDAPIPLTQFEGQSGEPISRPPQNMFYASMKNN